METPVEVQRIIVEKAEAPKPIIAEKIEKIVEKPVEKAVENPVEKMVEPAPEKPQIIRIVGLDEGPREIILPAERPEKKNP